MKRYPAIAINQIRAKDGNIYPKAPAGMAVPVGYELSEDGTEYIKQPVKG